MAYLRPNKMNSMRCLLSPVFLAIMLFYMPFYQAQTVTFQSVMADTAKHVLVAAHRGDWFNFPENSIPGVLSCIEFGVDIVEIDVQRTKDGKYILMHDGTVNRTTNGKGKVSAYTLESITKLKLKDRSGKLTEYTVPTLDTILKLTKGRILVNVDKSAGRFNELIPLIGNLGCGDHVMLKGTGKGSYFNSLYKNDTIGAYYMPILSCSKSDIDSFLIASKTPLVEFLLSNDTSVYSRAEGLDIFRRNGTKIWYNALFSSISGGHNESYNATASWDWFIEHEAYIIQTDYPFYLLNYLVSKGLRPNQTNFKSVDFTKLPNKVPKEKIEVKLVETVQKETDLTTKKEETTKKDLNEKPKTSSHHKKYYVVKSGDTLSKIAQNHKLTLGELLKLNANLSKSSILHKGQKIRVK